MILRQSGISLAFEDKPAPAVDLVNLLLQELNKGSYLAISLLTVFIVISFGLVAEAISKARITSPKVRDYLALTEATGKTVAALGSLFVLGVAAASSIGAEAVGAGFFVATLLTIVGFAVAILLVLGARKIIRRRWPAQPTSSGTPGTLVEICNAADSLANKTQQLENTPDTDADLRSQIVTIAKDSKNLNKQLKGYKSRARDLTGLQH